VANPSNPQWQTLTLSRRWRAREDPDRFHGYDLRRAREHRDNRNAGGCGLSSLGRTVRSDGDNDRYLPADEIGGERRQSIVLTVRPAVFDSPRSPPRHTTDQTLTSRHRYRGSGGSGACHNRAGIQSLSRRQHRRLQAMACQGVP
jgi:hypothetical protein